MSTLYLLQQLSSLDVRIVYVFLELITIVGSGSGPEDPPVCAGCTEVFGIGNGVASSNINTFFVRTKDCFGSDAEISGLNFTVDFSYQGRPLSRNLSSTSVVDLQNGLYLVEYTGNNFEGDIDISVHLTVPSGTYEVFGSPFTVDFYNPTGLCPNNCNDHGACVDGACVCTDSYQGIDCSLCNILPCSQSNFTALPPTITEATFSASGTSVEVSFDIPTNMANMSRPGYCDAIFNAATVALFGANGINETFVILIH